MESHIEVAMYGDSYRGFSVSRLLYRLQSLETHIECAIFGESYRI